MQSSSFDDNYWVLGIITFLIILCRHKYENIESLGEWIMEYLSQISPKEEVEEEHILELEELTDMISTFIIENKELFCSLKYKVKE